MKRSNEPDEPTDGVDPTSFEEDEEDAGQASKRRQCPYLDTVNRQLLDFDSEKLCSVTLTNRNVYGCLVCGKFFEGRGKNTAAFTHSLQSCHFVLMNLESGRSYCLPDSYEIHDQCLDDIRKCLSPQYTLPAVRSLPSNTSLARDVHSTSYLPGFIGLNNLNKTDDLNVVLHTLAHIGPLREFFLQDQLYSLKATPLVREFGLVMRKLWSAHNFKSTVSPQELVHRVSVESKRRFSVANRSEAVELMIWLLNTLKKGLGGALSKTKDPQSVVFEPLQGVVEVVSLTKRLVDNYQQAQQQDIEQGEWVKKIADCPFTYLSLDIPPCPLFRDSHGGLVIPQVPLYQLLQKFDGSTWSDTMTKEAHTRRQYRLKKLPRFLVLHLVRFTKNNFTLEKNPTIVTFPVRNLEMKDFLYADGHSDSSCPAPEALDAMSSAQLREVIQKYGAELHHIEAAAVVGNDGQQHVQLLTIATAAVERVQLFASTKYDLVANICHESSGSNNKGVNVGDLSTVTFLGKSKPKASNGSEEVEVLDEGAYKVHLHCKAANQWYELQDLHVNETTPQQIGVSESYVLVYEKKLTSAEQL